MNPSAASRSWLFASENLVFDFLTSDYYTPSKSNFAMTNLEIARTYSITILPAKLKIVISVLANRSEFRTSPRPVKVSARLWVGCLPMTHHAGIMVGVLQREQCWLTSKLETRNRKIKDFRSIITPLEPVLYPAKETNV